MILGGTRIDAMNASQDLTILLGAGASAEAGVPTARKMARLIYEASSSDQSVAKAIDVALGGLHFRRSTTGADPFGEVDVEDLYDVLAALASRDSNILAPFIGSWNQAVLAAEAEGVRGRIEEAVEQLRVGVQETMRSRPKSSATDFYAFGDALHDAIKATVSGAGTAFLSAQQRVRRELIRHCWVQDKARVSYLTRLFTPGRNRSVWIASVNYDNTIELAADAAGISLDLGIPRGPVAAGPTGPIGPTGPPIQFLRESTASLAKLHGSVSWSTTSGRVEVLSQPSLGAAVIFGGGSKLRVDGPYLDLLFAFRERLGTTDTLNVCGYSFRDTHINYLILSWLDRSPTNRMRVADPELTMENLARNVQHSIADGSTVDVAALIKRIDLLPKKASDWVATL